MKSLLVVVSGHKPCSKGEETIVVNLSIKLLIEKINLFLNNGNVWW